ncbi:MAG: Unknown protein, partial [uncultured Aureispira sp.]
MLKISLFFFKKIAEFTTLKKGGKFGNYILL